MRAASDDVRISDVKRTKAGFWEEVGLEGLCARGGTNFGCIRKEADATAAMVPT